MDGDKARDSASHLQASPAVAGGTNGRNVLQILLVENSLLDAELIVRALSGVGLDVALQHIDDETAWA
ncbi:MAG TPA: hypothetical protein VHA57_12490 [Actinomycetota bacterium]|nr:hypothetical protein [Actinomycetota bacterium]